MQVKTAAICRRQRVAVSASWTCRVSLPATAVRTSPARGEEYSTKSCTCAKSTIPHRHTSRSMAKDRTAMRPGKRRDDFCNGCVSHGDDIQVGISHLAEVVCRCTADTLGQTACRHISAAVNLDDRQPGMYHGTCKAGGQIACADNHYPESLYIFHFFTFKSIRAPTTSKHAGTT